MKPKLRLLFHVGYGKSASTYLQQQVFAKLPQSIYLGKNNQGLMYDMDFNTLHYRLFDSLNRRDYRSRNSSRHIREYVKGIIERTKTRPLVDGGGGNLVVSNETILGFGGYNAELNVLLLRRVVNDLVDCLSGDFDMSVTVLVVFREQVDLLQSYFAYNFGNAGNRFKKIEKFIESGLELHHEDIWGSLWIDEVHTLLRTVFSGDEILMIPYELLQDNPSQFLKTVLVDREFATVDQIEALFISRRVNVNRNLDGSHQLRDVSQVSKFIRWSAKFRKYVPQNAHRKIKSAINRVQSRQQTRFKGSVKIPEKQVQQIRSIFRESNSNAEEKLGVSLGTLGYATKNSP